MIFRTKQSNKFWPQQTPKRRWLHAVPHAVCYRRLEFYAELLLEFQVKQYKPCVYSCSLWLTPYSLSDARDLGFLQRFCRRLIQSQQVCTASLWTWRHHVGIYSPDDSVTFRKFRFFVIVRHRNGHCTLNVDALWGQCDLLPWGHRECPMGGGADTARGFSLSAFCCIQLQASLACGSQTKGLAFSEIHHVVVGTKILVYARRER